VQADRTPPVALLMEFERRLAVVSSNSRRRSVLIDEDFQNRRNPLLFRIA
jgi:hypothetical protein